ncbi:MAG: hypothetical protein CO162_03805 [bacterium (Candidatus Ratteibacteria) CG_4_9_14_3_um_filter_41_21]|uniref:Transcriptional regulator, AbiEi antitoxin, Type IV TA system n=1 Tax=bacterium (Candidatus Ratteibacteria) CG_4_9_14_3_um_filter_41_21 TaxID=2014289 RepID=A0A2M7YG09_9BACT|nr:MAG: hypothetical protein CO162_03805 [bacterium (Candidatus Ratteibacteria) CG_4_9_14_3_um_filter_41_21]
MKWAKFVEIMRDLPVIDTEILLAGVSDPDPIKVQISRWEKTGRIIQLKRGIYLLAEPYRKVNINEPYLASILKKPSYVSLEKALEYHDLIPEAVPVWTSITTKRPGKFITKVGTFVYRHIKPSLFWGYESVVVDNQTAFIASPEKGLLDLFYINKIDVSLNYLEELRLQNVEKVNLGRLSEYARRFNKRKISHAVEIIKEYVISHKEEEKVL